MIYNNIKKLKNLFNNENGKKNIKNIKSRLNITHNDFEKLILFIENDKDNELKIVGDIVTYKKNTDENRENKILSLNSFLCNISYFENKNINHYIFFISLILFIFLPFISYFLFPSDSFYLIESFHNGSFHNASYNEFQGVVLKSLIFQCIVFVLFTSFFLLNTKMELKNNGVKLYFYLIISFILILLITPTDWYLTIPLAILFYNYKYMWHKFCSLFKFLFYFFIFVIVFGIPMLFYNEDFSNVMPLIYFGLFCLIALVKTYTNKLDTPAINLLYRYIVFFVVGALFLATCEFLSGISFFNLSNFYTNIPEIKHNITLNAIKFLFTDNTLTNEIDYLISKGFNNYVLELLTLKFRAIFILLSLFIYLIFKNEQKNIFSPIIFSLLLLSLIINFGFDIYYTYKLEDIKMHYQKVYQNFGFLIILSMTLSVFHDKDKQKTLLAITTFAAFFIVILSQIINSNPELISNKSLNSLCMVIVAAINIIQRSNKILIVVVSCLLIQEILMFFMIESYLDLQTAIIVVIYSIYIIKNIIPYVILYLNKEKYLMKN